jgi:hypothetical protein
MASRCVSKAGIDYTRCELHKSDLYLWAIRNFAPSELSYWTTPCSASNCDGWNDGVEQVAKTASIIPEQTVTI